MMRRVSFKSVLSSASILWDGKVSPDARTAAQLGEFINRRAVEFWEAFPWPAWCPTERRFFAPIYDATVIAADGIASPDVRYYPPSKAYYQCLCPSPVAAGAPADTDGNVSTSQWAQVPMPCGDLTDWNADDTYSEGDQRQHPVTLRKYQARQDMSAGIEPGTEGGDYWGEIFAFFRVIPFEQADQTPIGECLKIWTADPRLCRGCEVDKEIIQEGVLVRGGHNVVWTRFRERAPSWTGAEGNHSLTVTYALAAQVWSAVDYYQSLTAGNLGNALTDTTKWLRLDFPYVLHDAVAQAAYADLLMLDGQHEKFDGAMKEAKRLLHRQFDKLERQQGQHRPLPVQVRC